MANQIMTAGTEVAALVPEQWSATFFRALKENFSMIPLIRRDYTNEISGLGDIVNVSTIPYGDAAQLIAEGEAFDAQSITATTTQIIVNSMAGRDFIVTRRAQLQSLDFMDEMRDVAAQALLEKLQDDVIAAIVPSASAPDHQIALDSAGVLALADILEAKQLLDLQSVEQANRHLVAGPTLYNDLYNVAQFSSRDYIPAGSPATSGRFDTQLLGFTPHLCVGAGSTAYLFHDSFMQLVMQDEVMVEAHSLGADGVRGMRYNSHILYGVKLMDSKRVVSLS